MQDIAAGLVLGAAILLGPAGARGADLLGEVRDPARLPIPGANVTLIDENRRIERTALTSAAGAYHFFDLPPGPYRASIDAAGFRPASASLELNVGARLIRDFDLQVAGRTDAVQVSAAPPLLQSGSGSESFLVDSRKVASLPLDGRNYIPLIALAPSVMLPPGSVLPRINGSRPRTSEYLYDGISVLQPEPGQPAWYPVVDAIAEFRVRTNSYSAEYGRSNGGVIEVATRAGGDRWRGTLFEFFRNEALNARNYFAAGSSRPQFRRNQYGFALGGPLMPRKTFLFADWQGTRLRVGAPRISTVPLSAERAGVFAAPVFDPATTRRSASGFERDAFPGNVIPASRWDPAAALLMERFPAANIFTAGRERAANNYRRTASEGTDADQFDIRLDQYISDRHRLFGRRTWLRDHAAPAAPLPDGSGAIASGIIGDTLTRGDGIALEHAWTMSPSSANQLRVGWTRRGFSRSSMQGVEATQATGIPGISVSAFPNAFPTFELAGYQQLGPPPASNARFTTAVTEIVDAFSRVSGAHTLKAGADIRHEQMDALQPPSPTGDFQFTPALTSALSANGAPAPSTGSSVASFLLGQVQAFSLDAQRTTLRPRANVAEFYLQDDWRASPQLTLNLGVRYTLNFPSTEADNHAAVFDLNAQRLRFLGVNGEPRAARKLELGNFGPRVGVAFRASDAFVVRAGYGLTWIEQAGITTPFTTPLFPFVQTISARSLDNLSPAFPLARGPNLSLTDPNPDSGLGEGVFAVQRDNGSGYAQQWNLTLQKTIGNNWSVEAGYDGSKLTRLGVPDVNLNQLRVEQLALGAQLTELVSNPFYGEIPESSPLGAPVVAQQQLLRPYPRFTSVSLYRDNVGHSTYHSLQTRIARRFASGFTLTAAYTFAKLIDDAGAVFNSAILTGPVLNYQAADSFNRRLEKDESTGSIPHVFSSGFVCDLPFGRVRRIALSKWADRLAGGWTIAGIVRVQSGAPVAVTQATNYNATFGFGIQRPNRVGDPNIPAGRRSVERWFDTEAFTAAPQFTIGNSSRNPVRGPGYQAADLMLAKTVAISDHLAAEIRAEAFNVTNTPALGNPNGRFGAGGFGAITTALDPRVFELAAKLHF